MRLLQYPDFLYICSWVTLKGLVRFSPGGESHSDPREQGFLGNPAGFPKMFPGNIEGNRQFPSPSDPREWGFPGIPFMIPGEYSFFLVLRGTYHSSILLLSADQQQEQGWCAARGEGAPALTSLSTIHLSNVVVSADRRDGRSTGGRSA